MTTQTPTLPNSHTPKPLTVTLIAPETPGLAPLHWIKEIGIIGAMPGVELSVVGGDVREPQAAGALRSAPDLVIWSGHGRENGLLLANGHVVTGRWVGVQARAGGGPRCLLLAACGSAVQDENLRSLMGAVAVAGVNCVGFPTAIHDEAAISYSTEFVRAMLAGADVGVCHEVACEAVEACCPGSARGIQLAAGLSNGYRKFEERLGRVERIVDLIARRVGVGEEELV